MESDQEHHPSKLPVETDAASALGASTLLTDVEKQRPSHIAPNGNSSSKRRGNLYGGPIDTTPSANGSRRLYAAKAQLLHEARLDMGMGTYEWLLFVATAVGWFLDEFWLAAFTVVLPSAANEAQFFFTYQNSTDLYVSAFAGLTLGAVMWPAMSDYVGRKQMFTATIVLMGMAGLVGAGMTAFTGLCVVGFVVGFAVGGNQSTSAIYLFESLPASHTYLVAVQGLFWGLGRAASYAIGYAFISGFTCGTGPDAQSGTLSNRAGTTTTHSSAANGGVGAMCHYVSNKGWRYTWWTAGCLTLFLYLLRFALSLHESPASLLARRRDAEAVQCTRDIAGTRLTWLSEAAFARVDSTLEEEKPTTTTTTTKKQRFSSSSLLSPSWALPALALLWAALGLAFPLHTSFLPLYLQNTTPHHLIAESATTVSRPVWFAHHAYTALSAIPGPVLAAALIELPRSGRRLAGAGLSLAAGVVMLAGSAAQSQGGVLAVACVRACVEAALLAVAFVYSLELFAAPVRGRGMAVVGGVWRAAGLVAWIVVGYASAEGANGGAVWFSGALCVVVAVVWGLMPRETRGKAAA